MSTILKGNILSKNKLFGLSAMALTAALVLSGCAASEETAEETTEDTTTSTEETTEETTETAEELSGSILVDGSSTVGPASEIAAELFMERNPGVRVSVNISGTGGGFEKFCNGETDGSNASRGIKDEEAALCEENGIAYDFVTVANDALSVVVNQDNPLECISVETLNEIWNQDSTLATWGEITTAEIPAAIQDEPIVLYGPGTDSGTFDYFTDEINGESGNIRIDYNNIGEEDDLAVQGVAAAAGGLSFIPYSYYQKNSATGTIEKNSGNGMKREKTIAVVTATDSAAVAKRKPMMILSPSLKL
jgi:phosphate transport system substrate-binding protein